MQWRVFDGMKMFATKERLAQIRERGESALRQQVSATILTTMSTYYALVQTDEQLRVTERMLQMVEERKRIADVRLSSGLSSRSDVLQARIDVNDALASLVSLRAQRRQTEISLLRCMGQDSSGSVRCADTVQVDSTINLAALRAALATANESVLQALSNIRISQAAKREAASAGYPGLELQAGYVFNRSQNSAGFALFNENNGFNVGANLSVPLLNGWRTETEMEIKEVQIQQQQHIAENVKRSVVAEFEGTAEEYRAACTMLPMLRESMDLATENSIIALERFRRSDITSTEIRAIQLEVLQRSLQLLQAAVRAKVAELRLRMLAGTLSGGE